MMIYGGPRDASPVLTLAELQAFDPEGQQHRGRYLCPLPGCGESKPRDTAHRSLKVELGGGADQGLWHCHRCGHGGRLREFWTPRPPSRGACERLRARRAMAMPAVGASGTATTAPDAARSAALITAAYARARPLAATAGAAYLAGRGIPLGLAEAAGLRLGVDRQGYPAVLFPIRDERGALVALAARYITDKAPLRMRTLGPAGAGVFAAPYIGRSSLVAITEAPLDALSLGAAGLPAIALGGTKNHPPWLRRKLAERTVLLATDADAAGETAAQDLAGWLCFGTRSRRLQPAAGCKDWNEVLQVRGLRGLAHLLELLLATGGGAV
jgi:hypothetical protein